MSSKYLLETSATDGYLLEDASGAFLTEAVDDAIISVWTEGWFHNDGLPNVADVYTDGWWGTPPGGEAFTKTLTDTQGITDTVLTSRQLYKTIADTLGITDTIDLSRQLYKALSDIQDITDTIVSSRQLYKALADTQNITDLLTISRQLYKVITDLQTITDALTALKGGGEDYIQPVEDTQTITDILTAYRTTMKYRAISTTQGIVDNLNTGEDVGDYGAIWLDGWFNSAETTPTGTAIYTEGWWGVSLVGQYAQISDTVGLLDYLRTSGGTITILIEDVVVGITDYLTKARARTKTILNTLAITDTVNGQANFIRKIFDTETILHYGRSVASYVLTIADNLLAGISDAINTGGGLLVNIADTVGITDVVSRVQAAIRAITDTQTITDYIRTPFSRVIGLASTAIATTAVDTARALKKAIANTQTVTTTVSRIWYGIRKITNIEGIIDSLNYYVPGLTQYIAIYTTEKITDTIDRTAVFIRTILNTVVPTTTIKKSRALRKRIYDSQVPTAVQSPKYIGRTKDLADTQTITDYLNIVGTFIRKITDSLGITDYETAIENLLDNPNIVHFEVRSTKTTRRTYYSDSILHFDVNSDNRIEYIVRE